MPATEQTWRNQKLLHKVFAVGSLVLLVSTIWMFAEDHDREWKDYQRKFRNIEVVNSRWDKVRAAAELNEEQLVDLKKDLLKEQSTPPDEELIQDFIDEAARGYRQLYARENDVPLEQLQGELPAALASKIERMENRIRGLSEAIESPPDEFDSEADELAWRAKNRRRREELLDAMGEILARATFLEESLADMRKVKASELDAAKSKLDLAIRDNEPTAGLQQQVNQVQDEFDKLTLQYQRATEHVTALQQIINQITAEERAIQKQISDNRAEIERITRAIDDREAHWIEGYWLGKKLLESPILDAFNSPLQIDNLWTEGLTHNHYNFKPVLRYDRCTTCHQAMEKTQTGSAVKPKYEPVHELAFALSTPTREEVKEMEGAGEGFPASGEASELAEDVIPEDVVRELEASTLYQAYGMLLASEGVLDRDDVTVSFVRDESRAAKASLADDENGVRYLSAELIESSVSAPFESEGAKPPQFGLMTGDVIVEINGDEILSNEDVRRKLLETVEWGQPVRVKVRRGYPNPYVTHPRLDLFVGSISPHKLQDLGCTVCHEGQGSATEFKWASHTPNTLKERSRWRKEYGWFNNHHWIFPMYAKRFAESSCLKCHHEIVELEPSERFPEPPAPQLMAGYNIVRRFGCFGCHEIVGYDGPDKRVGPDLRLEPNYFAAGLQLAYRAEQRKKKLQQRIDELQPPEADEPETMSEESLEAEISMLQARLETLDEAIERGRRLSETPYNDSNRRRLMEIVNDDKEGLDKFKEAVAQGEETAVFEPAFTPDAYNVAMVLQDEEAPGKYRKVGPSLRYVDTKLDEAFLDDWIRQPSHFRPSTRMPQFFRLFDHIQGDSLGEQGEPTPDDYTYPTGEKFDNNEQVHTAELEDVEIQGIRTYLQHYSQPFEPIDGGQQALAKAQQAGDAARGKVLFEIGGCLACHSNEDFPNHGDQGPDLSNLGSKLTGEQGRLWLYGWIQNPKRYHARTKMPVVDLKPLPGNEDTDPIADVVAYLLSDSGDWESVYANVDVNAERLDELALMHLSKTFSTSTAKDALAHGIEESRRSTLKGAEVELLTADELVSAGEQLSQKKKLLYIGSKSISKYGCYACHDIPGFEDAKPIGTALSDWGRKDPSKLAFEHINHYVGHGAHGSGAHGNESHANGSAGDTHGGPKHDDHAVAADLAYYEHQLHHHSRIGFIHQKLKEPRSYDYAKLANKPYNDRLRMPLFPLSHEQHEQVITFVLGLVADPPPEEFVYKAGPRQSAINEGRKVLDRFNCAGCHELEREEWQVSIPDGWDRLSPPLEPDTFPFLIPHKTQDEIANSQEVSRSGRLSAHLSGRVKRQSRGQLDVYAYDPLDEDYLPLELLEKDEYDPNALAYKFELYEPTLIDGSLYMPKESLPVIPMEMIQKRYARRGGDLAYYLLPRVLEYTTPANQTKGEEAWGWVPPSLVGQGRKTNPDWLHSFLLDPHPIRPAVMLNMPKFNMSPDEATKLVNYFSAKDSAEYPYQFDERKRTAHLAAAASRYRREYQQLPPQEKELFTGDRFDDVMRIVTSQAGCVKCHSVGDYVSEGDPRAKGPNLWAVHERLQPEYVRNWIAKPSYILPYTAMPELIKYSPENPEQDGFYDSLPDKTLVPVYHGSSTEQLDALVDLLMNLDEFTARRAELAQLVPESPAPGDAGEETTPAAEPSAGEAPANATSGE